MKKRLLCFLPIILLFTFSLVSVKHVGAEENLSDIISEELEKIDMSELEKIYDETDIWNDSGFIYRIGSLINGNFAIDYSCFAEYLKKQLLGDLSLFLPIFTGVIIIAVLCSLLQNFKSSYLSDGVGEVVSLVCFSAVSILLFPQVTSFFRKTENVISDIAKTAEIMSPIMLTLMTASGAKTSANLYKPSLVFLTNGVINVYGSIVLPLTVIVTVFSVTAVFSKRFKLSKFTEFFASIIKWIVGLIVTVFGVYLSAQGIASASYDGISFKTAKYLVSSSVPIVGGFLKDGFDLVIAGSAIIKNSVGIIGLIVVFYKVLSPVLAIAVFSLLLKAVAAITEAFDFSCVSALSTALSKGLSYLVMSLLTVGLMFFLVVLLMIISAGSFV